jgi:hypothetical protein
MSMQPSPSPGKGEKTVGKTFFKALALLAFITLALVSVALYTPGAKLRP